MSGILSFLSINASNVSLNEVHSEYDPSKLGKLIVGNLTDSSLELVTNCLSGVCKFPCSALAGVSIKD
jgi:hypothetical protein